MAYSFNNGVVTDDQGKTYDLNSYAQSAKSHGDTAGNLGALNVFYDNWNQANQPAGAVTNPTGMNLDARYNVGLMDRAKTNALSAEGAKLLPQITDWYNKLQAPQGQKMEYNALTGQSQPSAPPLQTAQMQPSGNVGWGSAVQGAQKGTSSLNSNPLDWGRLQGGAGPAPGTGDNGNAARNADIFNNPPNPNATPAAQTGVGAGRGYPSNWNANGAPGLASSGEGTTFATNPETGAAYETSPMYQWQLKQGEKSINRALAARGRKNSSVGLNTLANFYNQLGAGEADKQYNRTFDQQKLGMQAALAQAQAAGASSSQLAQLYANLGNNIAQGSQGYGANIADLIKQYGNNEATNQLGLGQQAGAAAMWKGTPIGNLLEKSGGENAQFWTALAQMGGDAVNAYMKSRG